MLGLTKSMSGGFNDVSQKSGIITGYLNAFNVKDSDGDITVKGAFSKTISENGPLGKGRIKYLLDHDKTKAVGVFQVLKEDDYGLFYEAKAGNHTLGQDYLKMVEDKIVTEHSFGYQIISEKFDQSVKANYLTELRVYEGSGLQFWGANPFTPITGVKSESDLLELYSVLSKALKNGTYSDETYVNIIVPKHTEISELLTKYTKPQQSTSPSMDEIKSAFQKSIIIN